MKNKENKLINFQKKTKNTLLLTIVFFIGFLTAIWQTWVLAREDVLTRVFPAIQAIVLVLLLILVIIVNIHISIAYCPFDLLHGVPQYGIGGAFNLPHNQPPTRAPPATHKKCQHLCFATLQALISVFLRLRAVLLVQIFDSALLKVWDTNHSMILLSCHGMHLGNGQIL